MSFWEWRGEATEEAAEDGRTEEGSEVRRKREGERRGGRWSVGNRQVEERICLRLLGLGLKKRGPTEDASSELE